MVHICDTHTIFPIVGLATFGCFTGGGCDSDCYYYYKYYYNYYYQMFLIISYNLLERYLEYGFTEACTVTNTMVFVLRAK